MQIGMIRYDHARMSTETEITKPLRGGWSQQLGILLESTGEGIYGIDLKGRFIFINSADPEIVGYTPIAQAMAGNTPPLSGLPAFAGLLG
jgi:PAS domain-containing protein